MYTLTDEVEEAQTEIVKNTISSAITWKRQCQKFLNTTATMKI